MTVVEKQAENAKNKQIKKATGFTKSQPTGFDTDSILGDGDIVVMPTTMPEVSNKFLAKMKTVTTFTVNLSLLMLRIQARQHVLSTSSLHA
jgi:hypothetical protein